MNLPRAVFAILPFFIFNFSGQAEDRGTPLEKIRDQYDVVIAGAGTGGFGAAVQAARLGVSVLVLEETDWIGGQMNAAAVTSMDEGVTLVRERGLYHEFVDAVTAHYEPLGISPETAYWANNIGLEPRVGQQVLYDFLAEARTRTQALDLSLRSKVSKVLKAGDTVTSDTVTGVEVQIFTPQGLQTRTIQSKVLIDATEWGDVIPLTGARYRVGNCKSNNGIDPTRQIQDATWTAVVKQYPHGVPAELQIPQPPPGYTEKVAQAFAKTLVPGTTIAVKTKPWTLATFLGYRAMPNSEQPSAPPTTRTHLNYNNDYPLTVADIEDRRHRQVSERAMRLKTLHLLYYLQTTLGQKDWSVANDEGYDSPYNREEVNQWLHDAPELEPYRPILNHFSVMAYARESRRIIGQHTLIADEIDRKSATGPKVFETSIAIGDYAIDLHGSMRPEWLELDLDRAENIPSEFGTKGVGPFTIPFECFIPEKIDGFLPAEKNLSQSRLANGATRLQPSTMLTGQAVGTIAALSIRYGVKPRDLDPVLVQQVLLEAGDTLYSPSIRDISKRGAEWPAVQLAAVHGLLKPVGGLFSPGTPITNQELAVIVKILNGQEPAPASADATPVTQAQFAQAILPALDGAHVRVTAAPTADHPISRLEAARVLAAALELRALAKTTGQPQTLAWPAPLEATPVTAADRDPQLASAVQRLVARGLIESPEYWLTHATEGETCDGALVRQFLEKAAGLLQPGSAPDQAIQICAAAGIFGSADYWDKNAAPGKKCEGKNVAIILRRVARQIAQPKHA